MTTLTDLIERLERAEKGSDQLDAEIAFVITSMRPGVTMHEDSRLGADHFAFWEDGICHNCTRWPRMTQSLDAALTLVPEGWRPLIRRDPTCWRAALNTGKLSDLRVARSESQTPALALAIACLRARAS